MLLESVIKLRKFGERLQGCIWASQRELLPAHRMLQEQLCLCYSAVASSSEVTLEACVTNCPVHPGSRLLDIDPAGVGSCWAAVFILFHEFPQGCLGSGHEAPVPRRAKIPRAILEGQRTMLIEKRPGDVPPSCCDA